MALSVETGSGAADAESYASVAAYKAYCDGRGISYSARTDTQIEQDLRKGTDAMMQMFSGRWAGTRVSSTQALDWPRYNVPMKDGPANLPESYGVRAYYPSDAVPAAVMRACIEMAVRAATATLIADGAQAVKREKIGPLEVEYQDATTSGTSYRAIEGMLAPFMVAANGQIRLARG